MLKILLLPFKIIKWFFALLFIALGLFLVGLLIYVTNIMRDVNVLNQVANPLSSFLGGLNGALGGNVSWISDMQGYFANPINIQHVADTSNIIFGVTIGVVCLSVVITITGIVLKILNKVRKKVT